MVGLVNGSTAERVSKMFGKTEQDNFSTSMSKDTSVSYNTQSKELLPASKIMSLSQGQFIGKFADTFSNPIELKLFSGYMSVPTIEATVKDLPLKHNVTQNQMNDLVKKNSERIREEIQEVITWCNYHYTY
mgnify:FL=1